MKTINRRLLAAFIAAGTFALAGPLAQAQEFKSPPPFGLVLSYFGDMLLHPGLRVGMEASIARLGAVDFPLKAEAGFFWHVKNRFALTADLGAGARFEARSGFHVSLNAMIGYQHSFNDGATYTERPGGAGRILDPGSPALTGTVNLLLGGKCGGRVERWFAGPAFTYEYPYNGMALPRIGVIGGASLGIGGAK